MSGADALALIGLGVACVTDALWWRIPNWLTFSLCVAGASWHLLHGAWALPLLGFVAATAIHVPMWMLQVEKAGDSKLYMALGAVVGWQFVVEATLYKLVLHVPFGLFVLWVTGNLANLPVVARHLLRPALVQLAANPAIAPLLHRAGMSPPPADAPAPTVTRIFWAPVITGGYLVARYVAPLHLPWR
jgi:Flp pilus assembly protein protease CpaA